MMLGRRGRRTAVDTPRDASGGRSDGGSPGRARRGVAAGLTVLVSLVVLFAPAADVPSNIPPGTDKVVHALLFAALAFTARRAGAGGAWLGPALLAYAVGSELVQASSLLGRSASGWDALADAVGVALGLLAARPGSGAARAERGRPDSPTP